jgi:hypothetical protein
VPDTSLLLFDSAAAQAWLRHPSETHAELTRAETLDVDEELTGRGGRACCPPSGACQPPVRDAIQSDDTFRLLPGGK